MLSVLPLVAAGVFFAPAPTPAPAAPAAVIAAATPEDDYAALAEKVAPAIVGIHYVMAVEGGGADFDQSQENEIHGVLIDPKGIVLISSAAMFGYEGMGVQIRPQEIKILIGDDTQGKAAEVVVRDRERDLAWLRITDDLDGPLPAVDFENAADARPGQTVLQVWKLDKLFDRAPYISAGTVAAVVAKPRDLFIGSGEITMGLPVFSPDGKTLGFCVLQLPTQEEIAAMSSSNMYSNMIFARTVLPARTVQAATTQALAVPDDEEGD
jgi:hypothetical protein